MRDLSTITLSKYLTTNRNNNQKILVGLIQLLFNADHQGSVFRPLPSPIGEGPRVVTTRCGAKAEEERVRGGGGEQGGHWGGGGEDNNEGTNLRPLYQQLTSTNIWLLRTQRLVLEIINLIEFDFVSTQSVSFIVRSSAFLINEAYILIPRSFNRKDGI